MAAERENGEAANGQTVADLRAQAAELEIPGRSAMNKAQLQEAIAEARGGGGSPAADATDAGPSPVGPAGDARSAGDGDENWDPQDGDSEPAQEEPSEVDAMGLDKRRGVVGKSYGASLGRQAALYGIFIVFVAALAFGGKMLADKLDEPPAEIEAKAPWKDSQDAPKPLDFPEYGEPEL